MALAIALIVLLLISIMIAGLAWLLMGDQKLGGNNADRQRAFYGAEAGLESLTASLENAFNAKYALTAGDITALTQTPPSNVPGIQYIAPGGSNGAVCRSRGPFDEIQHGGDRPHTVWLRDQASAQGANRGHPPFPVRNFLARGSRLFRRTPV